MIRDAFRNVRSSWKRFRAGQSGGGAIELVLVLPVMMGIFISATECGLYMTRQIMLERAVDIAVRDLRLGRIPNPNHVKLKKSICANTVILPDCSKSLRVELLPISTTTWAFPTNGVECVDRAKDIEINQDFNPGADNELMLVRVCLIQDAIFPGASFAQGIAYKGDAAGGYALVSVSSFVNEPK
jgi:hypothetical protein